MSVNGYLPDPPCPSYEPEYSGSLNDAWLTNYRVSPREPALQPTRHVMLLPQTCIDRNGHDAFPDVEPARLGIIRGGKKKGDPTPDTRRDGASVVVECASILEHACFLFSREADDQMILDVEPHLRRAAKAVNQLTRQASRARRKQNGTLFQDVDVCPDTSGSLILPVFNLDDMEGIKAFLAHREKARKDREAKSDE